MKLTLEIEMDNAVFWGDGSAHDEAARILRDAAAKIEAGAWGFKLRDFNGNTVGKVVVDEN